MNGDEKSKFSMFTKFMISNFKNIEDLPLMFQRYVFSGGKIYFLNEKRWFSMPNKFLIDPNGNWIVLNFNHNLS